MNKKGQITAILLIGTIILIGAAIYFMSSAIVGKEKLADDYDILAKLPAEVKPVAKFVQECLKKEAGPALELLGQQGGYLILPEDHLSTDYSNIAYLYDNGENKVPSLETMEIDINSYLDAAIQRCAGGFEEFKSKGYQIKEGDVKTRTRINKDNVILNLNYPLTVTVGGKDKEVSEFRTAVKLRLGYIHSVVNEIVEHTKQNPEYLDLTYLTNLPLQIDVVPESIESFVLSVQDTQSQLGNKPYLFLIANRMKKNYAPMFEIPSKFSIENGKDFVYEIKAKDPEGDEIYFKDDTSLFDISDKGNIQFKALVPGVYDATITVTDSHGNYNLRNVKFVIEEPSGQLPQSQKKIEGSTNNG